MHGHPLGRRICASCGMLLLFVSFSAGACTADGIVTLILKSWQDVYVLHEPLLMTGEMVNNSSQQIRIYGIEKFGNPNMPCLFLEIITPDGRKHERRTFEWEEMLAKGETYRGEPLDPSQRFAFDIFPNHLSSIYGFSIDGGWAFPSAGEYKLRLVYEVEPFRIFLWKPSDNRLYSNQITVRVVEPSTAQKEILDAYWAEPFQGFGIGGRWETGEGMFGYNIVQMNRVLVKYPAEPFIKYIHYALLYETLRAPAPNLANAQTYAQYLMKNFPDFRPGRVRKVYAQALIESGRKTEGVELLEEALRLEPHMKDDHDFMSCKIMTERGEKAYWPWKSGRCDDRANEGITPRKE